MRIHSHHFAVAADEKVDLKKRATAATPVYRSKRDYRTLLQQQVTRLATLQRLLYASNRYSLLLIFQAMDAAGKDGAISHVMSGVNPQGCRVYSFKHPSESELEHDFLWRTTRVLPERGQIGIFNRSYYEEVLIVRVHPQILRGEGLPPPARAAGKIWKERFRSIVNLESHLRRNGTVIVKFFLHISAQEQRKRFLQRIDDPEKNWKFSVADIKERGYWKQYMHAYEQCLSATSSEHAAWYVIPADDKRNAHLIISQIIVDTLAALKMSYPKVDDRRRAELRTIRAKLLKEHL